MGVEGGGRLLPPAHAALRLTFNHCVFNSFAGFCLSFALPSVCCLRSIALVAATWELEQGWRELRLSAAASSAPRRACVGRIALPSPHAALHSNCVCSWN